MLHIVQLGSWFLFLWLEHPVNAVKKSRANDYGDARKHRDRNDLHLFGLSKLGEEACQGVAVGALRPVLEFVLGFQESSIWIYRDDDLVVWGSVEWISWVYNQLFVCYQVLWRLRIPIFASFDRNIRSCFFLTKLDVHLCSFEVWAWCSNGYLVVTRGPLRIGCQIA